MANVIEKTGSTIDEAIQAALNELGVTKSDVDIEVLETPTKKIFGLFGGTPAKIRATLKEVVAKSDGDLASVNPAVEENEIFDTKVAEPAPVADENISTVAPVADENISDVAPTVEEKIEPILAPSPVEENSEREAALERAENFLHDVFDAMNLKIEIYVEEFDDGWLFDLSGKGLGVLIGRHGQALDSLQYLLNLAANRRDAEEKFHFMLDVEGYRERRTEALEKLALNTAERAVKTRRDVRLEPMNRHERKVIHTTLQDNDRVETHSAGTEPYRYVIISPKRGGRR